MAVGEEKETENSAAKSHKKKNRPDCGAVLE
jgi:hypothetical protein